ncbi:MAG: transcription repressor NadR [Lachnospiraceae bacterium]|nr:transcription repressor NadR [Lachnospiraceae bacterium]
MSGQARREQLLQILKNSKEPVSGLELAKNLEVSRQVIVQDIALLRANNIDIMSTNRGYVIAEKNGNSRVFKVIHTEEQVEEELNLFVDYGGKVEDVFVFHKVYGVVKADLNIKSRRDVKKYLEELSSGKSTQLMKLTSNYHYHTISADNEETLDLLQEELYKRGFLAKLQDYEPVDFWGGKD